MNGPKMRGILVPLMADPVASPRLTYNERLVYIDFLTRDGGWARVTFEQLDSIRVSRGEYHPYPNDTIPGEPLTWVSEVVPSLWLLERYEYEKTHYGEAYKFVEMLTKCCATSLITSSRFTMNPNGFLL